MHSPFPWRTHPQTPTAVFDADGKRIVDAWRPVAEQTEPLAVLVEFSNRRDPGMISGGGGAHMFWGEELGDQDAYIKHLNATARVETITVTPLYAASVEPPTPLDPETAADNAALIAAIPGMVEALRLARAHIDGCDYDTEAIALVEQIDAVLASIGRKP